MSNKNKNKNGLVYSTEPGYNFNQEQDNDEGESMLPEHQNLKVFLDRKGGGKVVSRVSGFVGNQNELDELGSLLKKLCGGGGSVKEYEVLAVI